MAHLLAVISYACPSCPLSPLLPVPCGLVWQVWTGGETIHSQVDSSGVKEACDGVSHLNLTRVLHEAQTICPLLSNTWHISGANLTHGKSRVDITPFGKPWTPCRGT